MAAFLAVMLSGCVKRELEGTEGSAEIRLSWDCDEPPQAVRFLFYSCETGALVKEVSGLADGFTGILPVGKYRLVVHNTDARQIDYRGTENYETAEVFAQETEYATPSHTLNKRVTRHDPGVPCILEPQAVYGTGICNEFETFEINFNKTTQATVTPISLTRQMEFHFTVKCDAVVESLTGVLDGVAPGVFLASGRHNASSSCALEFTAQAAPAQYSDATAQDYMARLGVFSLLTTPQSPEGTNTVYVTLTLADGRELSVHVDLTPTLKEIIADNGGEIPIEIPVEVTLETYGISGELTATVTPWDDSGSGSGKPRPQAVSEYKRQQR